MHLVGLYYANISRCTVHRMLKLPVMFASLVCSSIYHFKLFARQSFYYIQLFLLSYFLQVAAVSLMRSGLGRVH